VGAENAEKQTNISSLCLVVALLVSLMKNQVAGLRSRGITAAIIGPEKSTAAKLKDIRLGRFNLVFGSPEALLNSHRTVVRNLKDSITVKKLSSLVCVDNLVSAL